MADLFERLVKNYGPIGQHRERAHGYFAFPKLEGEIGTRMQFRGKDVIVWSLNNYLGLANHPEVREADAEAASAGESQADEAPQATEAESDAAAE